MAVSLTVNGKQVDVPANASDMPLLWVLRDLMGLTGAKFGCGIGMCGACSVLMGDERFFSCMAPARAFAGQPITTIEGLRDDPIGRRLQDAWIEVDVSQCGYCQPGQLIAATALLKTDPAPDDRAIEAGMSGNICRCGTYLRIRDAVKLAAARAKP